MIVQRDRATHAAIDTTFYRCVEAEPEPGVISRVYYERDAAGSASVASLTWIEQRPSGTAGWDSVTVIVDVGWDGLLPSEHAYRRQDDRVLAFRVESARPASLEMRLPRRSTDVSMAGTIREPHNLLATADDPTAVARTYEALLNDRLSSYAWGPITAGTGLGPGLLESTAITAQDSVAALDEIYAANTDDDRPAGAEVATSIDESMFEWADQVEICTVPAAGDAAMILVRSFDVDPQWVGEHLYFWRDSGTGAWRVVDGPARIRCGTVSGHPPALIMDVSVQLYHGGSPSRSMVRVPIFYADVEGRLTDVSVHYGDAYWSDDPDVAGYTRSLASICEPYVIRWAQEFGLTYGPARWAESLLVARGVPRP